MLLNRCLCVVSCCGGGSLRKLGQVIIATTPCDADTSSDPSQLCQYVTSSNVYLCIHGRVKVIHEEESVFGSVCYEGFFFSVSKLPGQKRLLK